MLRTLPRALAAAVAASVCLCVSACKISAPIDTQLVKSTIIFVIAACVLLATVLVPSEYPIDPTGLGFVMGLTEMGEIKTQLAEEAELDRLKDQNAGESLFAPQPTSVPAPQEGSNHLERIIREFGISASHAQDAVRHDEVSITLQPVKAQS